MADGPAQAIEHLLRIMARLRDPEGGCPWDVEQTFASIAPYTIEEAYEVDDAIRRGDLEALRDELGDLLLQVVFHARMAEEAGHFDFGDVARALCEKLVRRHPHVFADAEVETAADQVRAWEDHKSAERAARAAREGAAPDPFADVPAALPALARAAKLARRAARAGAIGVAPPLDEAWERLRTALAGRDPAVLSTALGPALLALAAEATRRGVEAEDVLRDATYRFQEQARAALREPDAGEPRREPGAGER